MAPNGAAPREGMLEVAGTGGRGGGRGEGGRRVHWRGEKEQPVRVDGREGEARVVGLQRGQEAGVEGKCRKLGSDRLIPCRDTPHTQYGGEGGDLHIYRPCLVPKNFAKYE